jgi:hypothetical protein
VYWPVDAKSAIVVAVEHAEAELELDWSIENDSGGTPGNRKLIAVNDQLAFALSR